MLQRLQQPLRTAFTPSARRQCCAAAQKVATRAPAASRRTMNSRFFSTTRPRAEKPQPVDDPNFVSTLDLDPTLIRPGRRHGPGLIILGANLSTIRFPPLPAANRQPALIPITAFVLGTWQVQRLGWKTDLIARFEDRLVRDPLPLPPQIDPAAVHDFDYRRVLATGRLRHDQEMLIGPRMRDGQDGFMVVTPLERDNGSTVLVNRGWISKKHRSQRSRPDGLPTGTVTIEGLLREPWKKNMFTPENRPDKGEFYFPDVKQMAELTGAQPVWVEATMGASNSTELDFGRVLFANMRLQSRSI